MHVCMSMGQSIQAAVKKIPDTGQLINRRLLLTVLEAGRRRGLRVWRGPSSWFSLCPHAAEGVGSSLGSLSLGALIPS